MKHNQPPRRYEFAGGTVSGITRTDIYVLMDDGTVVRSLPIQGKPPFRLAEGMRVTCSWYCRRNDGRIILDPTAIEPSDYWSRAQKRVTRFPEHAYTLGKICEPFFAEALEKHGVRAHQASIYEDECLHVDVWVFLRIDGVWDWFPLDLTLRKVHGPGCSDKLERGKRYGVIPLQITSEIIDSGATIVPWTIKNVLGTLRGPLKDIELVSRRAALMLEDSVQPDRVTI